MVALTAIVAGITAGVYSATLDPVYRAEASLLVGQRDNAVAPALGAGGSVEPVMQTMEDLLTSDLVAAGVVRRLEGERSPGDILDPLGVTARPESTVMRLRYDAADEEQATQTLTATVASYLEVVHDLRDAPGESAGGVSVRQIDAPHGVGRVDPQTVRNVLLASGLGLVLGLLIAAATGRSRRR
ncbi:MAG: hypothetical protein KDC36_12795 [Thermoleophilia bacterium]|nr:hypothetical protein [Thermoleophilia bacterium]